MSWLNQGAKNTGVINNQVNVGINSSGSGEGEEPSEGGPSSATGGTKVEGQTKEGGLLGKGSAGAVKGVGVQDLGGLDCELEAKGETENGGLEGGDSGVEMAMEDQDPIKKNRRWVFVFFTGCLSRGRSSSTSYFLGRNYFRIGL